MKNSSSQTQQNLLKAFAGESMARNKYTQFAKIARKEGWEWIARVFEETADNERAHAAEQFEQIKSPVLVPEATLEINPYGDTLENLRTAAAGEHYEWTSMYPDFEKVALAEKAMDSARLFGKLKQVEERHEERYIIIARKLDSKTLYNSDTELEWKCVNCGYIYKGKAPPQKCPLCLKPQPWYMPLNLVQ